MNISKIIICYCSLFLVFGCNKKLSNNNLQRYKQEKSEFNIFLLEQDSIYATKEARVLYWENLEKARDLRREYTKRMSMLNENGEITRTSVETFTDLFQKEATVWNEIAANPYPTPAADYGVYVKLYMPNGVKAKAHEYGNYFDNWDKRLFKYYNIGEGDYEFYLHRAIEKTIYFQLDENMNIVSLGEDGKTILLDFITYINTKTGEAKIAAIKPLLK